MQVLVDAPVWLDYFAGGMALLTDPATAEPFVRHLGLRVPSV